MTERRRTSELDSRATGEGRQGDLERGRAAYARKAWREAHESLSRADRPDPLAAEELELLATSAYMLGLDDEYLSVLERAHHAYLDAGEPMRAARCAFWVGINHALRGELGPAGGWLGRARELVGEEDAVERGYLLMPLVFQNEARGDFEAAAAVAGEALEIAKRFGDTEAHAMAAQAQGAMVIKAGRVKEGLDLLDEAMVTVAGGKLSPIATGIVYCGVILACQEAYEVRRAQEWTAVLTRWCEAQPDLVAFTGRCLVHRAELMQLHGDWGDALAEAGRAVERLARSFNRRAAAQAFYCQGEILRLRGELDEAERAYREASRIGREPQPGLALLRLAQGRRDAAATAIGRALAEAVQPLRRANLLPAFVEIMLAAGDVEQARAGCGELEQIAARYESAMLDALVTHARGATELAAGDPRSALSSLRRAGDTWQELGAPYDAARARELVAGACRALGDGDTAALELEAAQGMYAELGARHDLERLESAGPFPRETYGLTPRQVEVLRLVSAGKSNREIAESLVISEHTVARHVQNIFSALGVSSRTAAGAFAFEHDLL